MHLQALGYFSVDLAQEPQELAAPVSRLALADDLAGEHVQGGEQCRGAVALVIAGHRRRPAFGHRQRGLGAIQCLHGGFLVICDPRAPFAARVTSPALFVAARLDDGPLSNPTNPHFYRVCPAAVKKLDIVPGAAHGTALLRRAAIVREIVQFLRTHDR
jgi:pimeloyl-ACP methyl ester carboxylesterase